VRLGESLSFFERNCFSRSLSDWKKLMGNRLTRPRGKEYQQRFCRGWASLTVTRLWAGIKWRGLFFQPLTFESECHLFLDFGESGFGGEFSYEHIPCPADGFAMDLNPDYAVPPRPARGVGKNDFYRGTVSQDPGRVFGFFHLDVCFFHEQFSFEHLPGHRNALFGGTFLHKEARRLALKERRA